MQQRKVPTKSYHITCTNVVSLLYEIHTIATKLKNNKKQLYGQTNSRVFQKGNTGPEITLRSRIKHWLSLSKPLVIHLIVCRRKSVAERDHKARLVVVDDAVALRGETTRNF